MASAIVLRHKSPEKVYGECCDFLPLLQKVEKEQGLTNLSPAGTTGEQAARIAIVRTRLEADPNLRNRRLRLRVRSVPRRRPVPAVQVPEELSPKARERFKKHRRQHR